MKSVDKILKLSHSNFFFQSVDLTTCEYYWAVFSCGAVYYALYGISMF